MLRIIIATWRFVLLPVILFTLAGSNILLLYKTGLGQTQGIEYKDLISILLTALGVLIAILAAILAILAVWGFTVIKDEARKGAEAAAREAAEPIAKVTAESVAARTAREALPSDTTAGDADKLADAMKGGLNE